MRTRIALWVAPVLAASAPGLATAQQQVPTTATTTTTTAAGASTIAQPRRLAFGEAVELALRNAPDVQAGAKGIQASEERASGARALRWARLRAEGNVLYWDKALTFPSGMSTSPLVVRERLTSQLTLTLAQPISGLFVLGRLIALEEHGAAAARADRDRAALDAAQRAAEAYLRLLSAKALATVAEQTVTQIQAQLERAQVLEKGGVLGKVDVLRLTSARENARQNLLRARNGAQVAAAGLALAVALPPGAQVDATDEFPENPPPLVMKEPEAAKLAATERPEMVAARERVSQGTRAADVARAQLLPSLNAVGSYQRTDGQVFNPTNAWFVGGMLTWDVWDWGKTRSDVREAEARAGQASLAASATADQVAFDAQRRLLEARTAYETLDAARAAVQAAEEAQRIQTVRYAQGAATTTDVLDAETDLARGRSGVAQARYDYYLAQAALARALGRLPVERAQPGSTSNVR